LEKELSKTQTIGHIDKMYIPIKIFKKKEYDFSELFNKALF